jgi:hypothetical protein
VASDKAGCERSYPALPAHTDKASLDPLNLDQWKFYVLSTARLTAAVGGQQTISLAALLRLHPAVGTFAELPGLVRQAHSRSPDP